MALAHMVLSVSYEDENGVPASTPFYGVFDTATTVATLLTNVAGFLADVANITLDKITGGVIGIETPAIGTADAGSISQKGVNISMETATTRDWGFWIPALDPALIVAGKVKIDSGAIFDLAASLVAGTGAITWETAYRNGFSALESAEETFRKLRGAPSTKSVNPV